MFKPKKKFVYRVRWLQPFGQTAVWREHHFFTRRAAVSLQKQVLKGNVYSFTNFSPALEAHIDVSEPLWFPVDATRTDEIPDIKPEPAPIPPAPPAINIGTVTVTAPINSNVSYHWNAYDHGGGGGSGAISAKKFATGGVGAKPNSYQIKVLPPPSNNTEEVSLIHKMLGKKKFL